MVRKHFATPTLSSTALRTLRHLHPCTAGAHKQARASSFCSFAAFQQRRGVVPTEIASGLCRCGSQTSTSHVQVASDQVDATSSTCAGAQAAARSSHSSHSSNAINHDTDRNLKVLHGAGAKAYYRTRLVDMLQRLPDATGSDNLSTDQATEVDFIYLLMQNDHDRQRIAGCLILGESGMRQAYDVQIQKTRRIMYVYVKTAIRRRGHGSRLVHMVQWSSQHGTSIHISPKSPMTFASMLFFATMDFTLPMSARSLTPRQLTLDATTPSIRMHCEWARRMPLTPSRPHAQPHGASSKNSKKRKRPPEGAESTNSPGTSGDWSAFFRAVAPDPRSMQSTAAQNEELRRQFNHNVGLLTGFCFYYRHQGRRDVDEAFALAGCRLQHRGFELTTRRVQSTEVGIAPPCTQEDREERRAAGRTVSPYVWNRWHTRWY